MTTENTGILVRLLAVNHNIGFSIRRGCPSRDFITGCCVSFMLITFSIVKGSIMRLQNESDE